MKGYSLEGKLTGTPTNQVRTLDISREALITTVDVELDTVGEEDAAGQVAVVGEVGAVVPALPARLEAGLGVGGGHGVQEEGAGALAGGEAARVKGCGQSRCA